MLELTESQQAITKVIQQAPAPGKYAARNAVRHIEKAWEIRNIDPEMATFRAITGEEELVTAIFRALQRRGYRDANRLSRKNHKRKAAVRPFFIAVAQSLRPLPTVEEKFQIVFDDRSGQLEARIFLPVQVGEQIQWLYLERPFDFSVIDEEGTINFSPEIERIVTDNNAKSIIEYIRTEANERNQVLYATDTGITRVQTPIDKTLLQHRDIIFRNLLVFHLIDAHPQQMFVQHCLDAFLKMLNLVSKEELSEAT